MTNQKLINNLDEYTCLKITTQPIKDSTCRLRTMALCIISIIPYQISEV